MEYQQNVAGVGTSASPGFCRVGNNAYLVWKGEGTDANLYFSKATTPSPNTSGVYQWGPQQQIVAVGTSDGPAAAGNKDALCMAWKGEGNDVSLYFSAFDGK